jgi:hypothetical protein
MKTLWLAAAFLALNLNTSQGVNVFLDTNSAAPNDLLNSSGLVIDSAYSFSLGAFETGFTPTLSNMDQWQNNWRPLEVASQGAGWDSNTQLISDTGVITAANTSQFDPTNTAYLWVYNTQDYASGSEWALLYDNDIPSNQADPWTFPNINSPSDVQLFVQDLDASIVGGANNVFVGERSFSPNTFTIQTSSVQVAPIPEPGSCLLVGLAGLALRLRRRRA